MMASPIPYTLAEMPLQDKRRADLYSALVDNDNYYSLSLVITKRAMELTPHAGEKTARAKRTIEHDRQYGRRLFHLLHVIPRDLLEAIILGNVAEFFLGPKKPGKSTQTYAADGPGTYVAAMAIRGRSGRFTNVLEDQQLIYGLKRYCEAYTRQEIRRGPPTTAADVALDLFAREVDSTFGTRPGSKPDTLRFIQNSDALSRVRWLVRSFERRSASAQAAQQQGHSLTTFRCQGPLMVGCSNQMDQRMPQHDPGDSSKLRLTTYTWALTLCLIKHTLRLDPVVVTRPVIRTWENGHLGVSEILVTALAASYVFQDGFNVIGAGTQNGDKQANQLEDCMKYVLHSMPYFGENADTTIRELRRRQKYINNVLYIARAPETMGDSIRKIQADLVVLESAMLERDRQFAKATELLEKLVKARKAAYERNDRQRALNQIMSAILGEEPLP
ncbi:hypothetical protein F4778DRAFT_667540 [Xylariomycetidae sp. FL2044]|nr:hypothetical protein F4778DRAFT_667540 [Xylariomycetidae sp. FL2044]